MEKIQNVKPEELAGMPFSYMSSAPFIDFAGYWFERNGERITVVQDVKFPHDFPSIFLPSQESNWERCSVMLCTDDQKKRVQATGIPLLVDHPIGTEFFYQTDAFLQPTGSLKKKADRFEKTYSYHVTQTCDPQRVSKFYTAWKSQKPREAVTFEESEQFYEFCLAHLEDYQIRQVYVQVDGELVGFAWGVEVPGRGWVGLHLKADYRFAGLSRFLHVERAKQFSGIDEFTLGTGAQVSGIEEYKRELHPIREVAYSYILTGDCRAKFDKKCIRK